MNRPATIRPAPEHAGASTPAVSAFEVPALPPLAAFRDRSVETAERSARRREDGYVDGYQAGLDSARADIEREYAEYQKAAARLREAAQALEVAARRLDERDRVALADIEHEVVALGTALAVELVGHELASADAPVLDALRRALALAPDRGTPMVRIHPTDEATVREALAGDAIGWPGVVAVIPDPSIELGGCIVDIGACRIDAQIAPAIERLHAALPDATADLLAP